MRRVVLLCLSALALSGCVLKSPPPSTIGAAAGGGSAYGENYGDAYGDPYATDPLQPPGYQGLDPERTDPMPGTFVAPAGWTSTLLPGTVVSSAAGNGLLAVATLTAATGSAPARSGLSLATDGRHWSPALQETSPCGLGCPASPVLLAADTQGDVLGEGGGRRYRMAQSSPTISSPADASVTALAIGVSDVGYAEGHTVTSDDGFTWRRLDQAEPDPAPEGAALCAHGEQTLALGGNDGTGFRYDQTGSWQPQPLQPVSLALSNKLGTSVFRCDQSEPALLAVNGSDGPAVWASDDLAKPWRPLGTLGLDRGDTVVDLVDTGTTLVVLAKRDDECAVQLAKPDGEKLGVPPTVFAGPCRPRAIQVVNDEVVVLLDDTSGAGTDAVTTSLVGLS